MVKEEALKVWNHEFGNVAYAHDFAGRKIKREDYGVENQVGWVVGYILPLKHGGKDDIENMVILHHSTAFEKGNHYPTFEVIGVKYKISYDKEDDYYYIEKDI